MALSGGIAYYFLFVSEILICFSKALSISVIFSNDIIRKCTVLECCHLSCVVPASDVINDRYDIYLVHSVA